MFATAQNLYQDDPTVHYDRSDYEDLLRLERQCSCGAELTARMARHSRDEYGEVTCENCIILNMAEGTQLAFIN